MNEAAFLARLRESPLDGLTRSVYADWLDDHGDPRAAFLRAEAAFITSPNNGALEAEIERMLPGFDEDWLVRAGASWDVWGIEYPRRRKIPFIKQIRTHRYTGLYEAKVMSETLPAAVVPCLPLCLALPAKREFEALMTAPPPPYPEYPDAPPIRVELRPATEEAIGPRSLPLNQRPAGGLVRLLEVRPDKPMSAARVVARCFHLGLAHALDCCLGPLPVVFDVHPALAADAVQQLEGLARAEVVNDEGGSMSAASRLVVRAMPSEERLPPLRRASIRVFGRRCESVAQGDDDPPPAYRIDERFPRFRAEEVVARLRGLVDLEVVPVPEGW